MYSQGGGGVRNYGNFTLYGGEISNNENSAGGGVVNVRDFSMFGGAIVNNIATSYQGGGVDTQWGSFIMYGGVISGNIGDGVHNMNGHFTFVDGVISNNINGSGVRSSSGNFSMYGGVITKNTGHYGGGVCINVGIFEKFVFELTGGEISNNVAVDGGGLYIGVTTHSFATDSGSFTISGCRISSNTATNNGGGIWIDVDYFKYLFISNDVVFENNRAAVAYNRNTIHDDMYDTHIGSNIVWTPPFTQGYNNYDISYTNGTPIDMGNTNSSDSSNNNNDNGSGSNSNNNNGNGLADDDRVFDTGSVWLGLFSSTVFIGAVLVVVIMVLIAVVVLLFQRTKRVTPEKTNWQVDD